MSSLPTTSTPSPRPHPYSLKPIAYTSPLSPRVRGISTFRLFDVCPQKNHPNREPPQPMPATALASVRPNFFRLLSPGVLHDLRASHKAACRLAMDYPQRCPVSPTLHSPAPPRPPRASSPRPQVLQISTFRRFDFSTFSPAIPTHARHKSCKRKKSRVSPYVTFSFAGLTRDQRSGLPFGDGPPAIPPPARSKPPSSPSTPQPLWIKHARAAPR